MFVLIHGGAHSSRCWEPTIPLLDGPVLAVDLPGRGAHPAPLDAVRLGDFVDSAVDDIERADVRDGVLVGHSMAGLSIPGILDRVPGRWRHVAFVSCVVPADGTALVDMMPPDIADFIRSSVPTPDGVVLSRDELLAQQCYDMDEEQTAFTLEVAVPEAYWPVREPVSLAGLRHPIPRTWVKLTADRIFPGEVQDEMAARTGCGAVVEVDSGHMAMISQPRALADVLNRIRAGA